MASVILAGTTSTTALNLTGDTSGELQLKTNNGSTTALTLTTGGNINIPTAGARITGDFSSGVASRVLVQSSTTNGATSFSLISNGTSTNSTFTAFAGSDAANSSGIQINANGSAARLVAINNGTSSAVPITFGQGNTEQMRIDTSGNVGIGTSSPSVKLEINRGSAGSIATFTDGVSTNFNFSTSGTVGTFGTDAGSTSLALKTAGVERMRITSAGDVFVGGTTGAVLGYEKFSSYGTGSFRSASSYALGVWNTANTGLIACYTEGGGTFAGGLTASGASLTLFGGSSVNINSTGANPIVFNTNSSERMRIASDGAVSIGTATALATLTVNGNITPVQAPSSNWGIDFAPSTSAGSYVTIANDATYDLAAGSGLVYVYDNAGNGVAQYFAFFGSVTVTNITGGFFAAAINTAGKVNLYYESGIARYRFQNKTGSTVNLFISTIRLRASA